MQLNFERSASTGYMVNCAARLMAREIDKLLVPHGLSSGYMPVFFALADGSASTQRDLARLAQVEQPTMAATLSRMERDGLIERTANPEDRRSTLVALSARGRKRIAVAQAAAGRVNAEATAGFSAEERAQLLGLLARLADNLARDQ